MDKTFRRFDSANKILGRIPKIYIPLCIIVIEKEKERQDGRDKRIQQRIDRKFHSKRYDTVAANFTIGSNQRGAGRASFFFRRGDK